MRYFLFVATLIFSANAFAEGGQSPIAEITSSADQSWSKSGPWTVEAHLYTASFSRSVTFGPTLFYALSERNHLGVRVLAPLSSDEGTSSGSLVYRGYLVSSTTSLFVEATLSQNFWNYKGGTSDTSGSFGGNLGVIHALTKEMSFGGLAGLEATQKTLNGEYGNINGYGRIAMIGALSF